ncbi:MAG: hypothetical protein D6770_01515 [Anaerolineae bacterium]|nr:MAG: hypothetical protein D6770_01515 [Anaerolineae bacterium]
MDTSPPPPKEPNTLGNASLALGIASTALVFGIGLCAITAVAQGWIDLARTPLFVCGASSAFVGLLAAFVGAAGLIGRNRPRATAIVGLILGMAGICLFLAFVNAVRGG